MFDAIGTDCMEIDCAVKLDEVPDMAILRGAGLEVSAQFDLKNRQAAYQAAAQYGSAKLGTVQLSLLDDLAAFGSPNSPRASSMAFIPKRWARIFMRLAGMRKASPKISALISLT